MCGHAYTIKYNIYINIYNYTPRKALEGRLGGSSVRWFRRATDLNRGHPFHWTLIVVAWIDIYQVVLGTSLTFNT